MNLIEALKSGKPFRRTSKTTIWFNRLQDVDFDLCLIGEDVKNGDYFVLGLNQMTESEFLADDWELGEFPKDEE